jgi:hypothetical protein
VGLRRVLRGPLRGATQDASHVHGAPQRRLRALLQFCVADRTNKKGPRLSEYLLSANKNQKKLAQST